MSDRTSTTVATSSPNAETGTHTLTELRSLLNTLPCYRDATPGIRQCMERDALACCGAGGEGLGWPEYAEGLTEWGGTMAEYLAESWELHQDGSMHQASAMPAGPELTARAAAFEKCVPMGKPGDQARDPITPAVTVTPAEVAVLNGMHPGLGETAKDVADAAAAMAAAKAAAEAREEALAEEVTSHIKEAVKAYRKGERAYRAGLLLAGKESHLACRAKLAINATKATRDAVCQAIDGQLAVYATSPVSTSTMIRAWAAWDLLCDSQHLAEKCQHVAYGHYKDAWSLVVQRSSPNTAQESWVLLPGLEEECRAQFLACANGTLDRKSAIEMAQALVHRHQTLVAEQAKAAKAATAAADRAAAETAARAKAEAKAAEEQALAAARDAEIAATQVKDATDETARLAALARHEEQVKAAEKARAEADHKRHTDEQAARDHASAAAEARLATKRAAETEAARVEADKKARARADKAAGITPDKAPPVETGAPVISPRTYAKMDPKAFAGMLAALIAGHEKPTSVARELVKALASLVPSGTFGKPEKVTPTALVKAAAFLVEGQEADQAAA